MEVGNLSTTQLGLVSEKYLGCGNTCLSLSKPCVFMPFSAVIKPLESTHQECLLSVNQDRGNGTSLTMIHSSVTRYHLLFRLSPCELGNVNQ